MTKTLLQRAMDRLMQGSQTKSGWGLSDTSQVDAELFGVVAQTFLLNGLEGAGADAQLDEALALGPPQATLLQIHLLQLLGAHVGVADRHAVVGALSGELADAGHGNQQKNFGTWSITTCGAYQTARITPSWRRRAESRRRHMRTAVRVEPEFPLRAPAELQGLGHVQIGRHQHPQLPNGTLQPEQLLVAPPFAL